MMELNKKYKIPLREYIDKVISIEFTERDLHSQLKKYIQQALKEFDVWYVMDILEKAIEKKAIGDEHYYDDFDLEVLKDVEKETKKRVIAENIKKGSGLTAKIVQKISILQVAREYGFEVRGNKAVCLFHADKDPSLSLDDSRGLFNCFGCNKKGNIVDFIHECERVGLKRRVKSEEQKNDNKRIE